MKTRKPCPRIAMQALLENILQQLLLGDPEAGLCQKTCIGCPKKLMAYLEQEVEFWQRELDDGIIPTLGEIQQLARSARKIRRNGKK